MNYHKIENISNEICTAEQEIAYNYAVTYYYYFKQKYDLQTVQIYKSDIVNDFYNCCLKFYKPIKNIDTDSVFYSLRTGAEQYLKHPFIAKNYKEIGNCFKNN